jgi:hypothetical protein
MGRAGGGGTRLRVRGGRRSVLFVSLALLGSLGASTAHGQPALDSLLIRLEVAISAGLLAEGDLWKLASPGISGSIRRTGTVVFGGALRARVSPRWFATLEAAQASPDLLGEFTLKDPNGSGSLTAPAGLARSYITRLVVGAGHLFPHRVVETMVELDGGIQRTSANYGTRQVTRITPTGQVAVSVSPTTGDLAPAILSIQSHWTRIGSDFAIAAYPVDPFNASLRSIAEPDRWSNSLSVSVGWRLPLGGRRRR